MLGIWIQSTEGSKPWLSILGEFNQQGVHDILVLCADSLAGMPRAVEAAFPQTVLQICILQRVRASTRFSACKEPMTVCVDLRKVSTATDEQATVDVLEDLNRHGQHATRWSQKLDATPGTRSPLLTFSVEIRQAIYTTNSIEALKGFPRKSHKVRGKHRSYS